MLRLLALLFLLPAGGSACSCIDNYVSLADRICAANTTGMVILEVVLSGESGQQASEVRVAAVTVGSNVPDRLQLRNGNGAMCGMSVAGDSPRQRYLLLADSASVASGVVNLFACGSSQTVYKMNSRGTQVEYPYVGPDSGGRPVGLRFQPFGRQLTDNACTLDPEQSTQGPLADIKAYPNPGYGQLQLGVPGGDFPGLNSLEVYLPTGSRVAGYDLFDYLPDSVTDLTALPAGYYLLVLSDGIHRRTIPYVVTR